MFINDTVGLFEWSILMRKIGSNWINFIVMICKYVENIRIRIQLSTLVNENIQNCLIWDALLEHVLRYCIPVWWPVIRIQQVSPLIPT